VTREVRGTPGPLVLVLAGTDHHPFARLVRFADLLAGALPSTRVLVQHGHSGPPTLAEGVDFLPHDQLQQLISEAKVVVTHGGPSTIAEVRRSGRRPLVVPRDPHLGEHVDDHQQRFSARLDDLGMVALVRSETELTVAVEAALREPELTAVDRAAADTVTATVARFSQLIDDTVHSRQGGPTVLYIGGLGRSGSTLLERLLALSPDVAASGEVVHLWSRGLVNNERCGCGEPLRSCPHWVEVGEKAFGGWHELDPREVIGLADAVSRKRHVPLLLVPGLRPSFRRRLLRLSRVLRVLYQAHADVSQTPIVLDSSKHPSYAYLLRHVTSRLRVVHLVRDSRGVSYSWTKAVYRPEIAERDQLMPRWSPWRTGWSWNVDNVLFHLLARVGVPVLRVRYEDLLSAPRQVVSDVLTFAGSSADVSTDLPTLADGHADVGPDHTVAGNPMRFTRGRIDLVLDEQWRASMPSHDRNIVTAVTWPLMRRYGYRSRGRRRPSSGVAG
jgi:UDP-N-acetylglucosamine transferase subunit ALG13